MKKLIIDIILFIIGIYFAYKVVGQPITIWSVLLFAVACYASSPMLNRLEKYYNKLN